MPPAIVPVRSRRKPAARAAQPTAPPPPERVTKSGVVLPDWAVPLAPRRPPGPAHPENPPDLLAMLEDTYGSVDDPMFWTPEGGFVDGIGAPIPYDRPDYDPLADIGPDGAVVRDAAGPADAGGDRRG